MKNRTRYVYYDKKTGFITDILKTRKRGRAAYISCDVDEVIGFLSGQIGMTEYVVAFNTVKEEHELIKKDNVILFREQSKELYKIPYKKDVETDLRLVYYTDNVLEVTLDMSRISPLYQTNFKDDVVFENGTEIRLVLKEKDSGNLLKEFVIDAQDLLESVQLYFELYDHIYPDNVEFFTYKMFNSYSWCREKLRLTSPMKERLKFEIHKADSKRRSESFDYHLIIKPTKKGIKIKNNITSLKLIRFHKAVEFFIVDKHDPNILYEKFFLDKDDFESKIIDISLDTDITDKTILYNQKYISALKEI